MRLTAHTDYALRIMLHAALSAQQDETLLSIAQVAADHHIPRNNAMKVVNMLANAGYLETIRGRNGGFRLNRPASGITLGAIVRLAEPSLNPADCGQCILQSSCGLTAMLHRAVAAFLAELDSQTLAQAAENSSLPSPISIL